MKLLKFSGLLFIFLSAIVSVGQIPPTIKLEDVKESAIIRRDGRGIPYIEAKNDADLYFAQGFATASDRLWQMDLYRRVARGETAEIFGKAALEGDKRWRKFGFAKIAEESLTVLSHDLKNALENYARGVNAYIATLDDKTLPVEFKILQYKPRNWQPTDTLVIGKILSDGLSTTWQEDLQRLAILNLPKEKQKDLLNQFTPYDVVLFGKDLKRAGIKPQSFNRLQLSNDELQSHLASAANDERLRKSSLERIGFYAEDLAASNNWVISPRKTADGKAILANDPHLQPTAPGIWYLTHLSTPEMRVAGVTFPGVPGIVLGHNELIAWGATNVGPDVQDLYLETFNAEGKYKTPAGWEAPIIRNEEIKVRKNPLSSETEIVNFEVKETRNGVIFTEQGDKKFALKWTARDKANQEFEAFFKLNRAENWEDFKNSLKTYGGAAQNFVYADTKGNIGWYAAGRIPIRKTGDGALPYDGATDDGAWTGYIPFEALPNLYNPAEGFIVTANQRTVGTDYKYFGTFTRDAALPWRARRISDLIKNNPKITIEDVEKIQFDSFNIPLKKIAEEIVKSNSASPETVEVLKSWDGRMTADSKGAIIINEIRLCLADKIQEENKTVSAYTIREKILWKAVENKSALWLPKKNKNYGEFISACDKDTQNLTATAKKIGNDQSLRTWGSLFKSTFPHPLTAAPLIGLQFQTPSVGIDGSGQTPNVGSNVSMRFVASAGNWDQTRHVIPLGESGNPLSPHYKDQFEAWRTGNSPIFPFTKSAVEAAVKTDVVFQPK